MVFTLWPNYLDLLSVRLDLQDMVDPNEPAGLFLDMLIQANGCIPFGG
jgi:hypothetical protein